MKQSKERVLLSQDCGKMPKEVPLIYICTYCPRHIRIISSELKICNNADCIQSSILDRQEYLFDFAIEILQKIEKLKKERTLSLQQKQYRIDRGELPESPVIIELSNNILELDKIINYKLLIERIKVEIKYIRQIALLASRIKRPVFPCKFREYIWVRDNKKCYICRCVLPAYDGEFMHIDHCVPRSKGGTDKEWNLRAACPSCNLKKSDKEIGAKKMRAIIAESSKPEENKMLDRLF